MNARHSFAEIAEQFTAGNPMRLSTPHTTVNAVCNAIRDMYMPGHYDFSQVLAVFASKLKASGAFTQKAQDSILDQLAELSDEIDQDKTNQDAERAYQLATRS